MNLEQLRAFKPQILAIAEKKNAYNVRVFGSVARGEATEDSDVDLLVTLKPEASLFDLGGLNYYISELLNTKVDVVPDNSIRKRLEPIILAEALPL